MDGRHARHHGVPGSAVAVVLVLLLPLSACGGGSGPEGSTAPLRIGGFDFTESSILAHVYAGALRSGGYPVELRLNLGNREVVAPALQQGAIDLYPGYAASEYGFGRSVPENMNAMETVNALRSRLKAQGLTALRPSAAVNTNAFAVTRSTAERYNLKKLTDLAPVAPTMVLGGPPECPNRPFCLAGLERVYGLRFREFRPLDAAGPLSKQALRAGGVDVIVVFSTDGFVLSNEIVVLEDDKHLQAADNVVPIIREQVATSGVRRILNKVSSALDTSDLVRLNKRAEDEDLEALAQGWLREHGLMGANR